MDLAVVSATLPWVFVILAYLAVVTHIPAILLWLPHLLNNSPSAQKLFWKSSLIFWKITIECRASSVVNHHD